MEELLKNEGLVYVSLRIFDNLDLKSILSCREINKMWKKAIDENVLLWKRQLQLLKSKGVYYDETKTVIEVFPEWKDVFDYYEIEASVSQLRQFVVALQSPFCYLINENNWYDELMSPLHIEAMRGHHQMIRLLVDSPMDFNSRTILVDYIRDPDDPNNYYNDDLNVALLDRDNGHTILHIAADNHDVELVKLLLDLSEEKKVDVNALDCNKSTPFHVVFQYRAKTYKSSLCDKHDLNVSQEDVIRLFLQSIEDKGVDVTARNDRERTPFDLYCFYGRHDGDSKIDMSVSCDPPVIPNPQVIPDCPDCRHHHHLPRILYAHMLLLLGVCRSELLRSAL